MTQRQPTLIFDCIPALKTLLAATTFPPLLGTGMGQLNKNGVLVALGILVNEPNRETIAVTGIVDDNDQSTWPEKGLNSKGETFTTELIVVTNVPKRSAEEAWARLQVIVQTIDAALRDMTTGRPIVPIAIATLGVYSWYVSSVRTALYPGDVDGSFVASAGVSITVKSHH